MKMMMTMKRGEKLKKNLKTSKIMALTRYLYSWNHHLQDEEVYGERVKRPTIASQDDEEAEVVDGGAQDDLDSVMVGVKRNSD